MTETRADDYIVVVDSEDRPVGKLRKEDLASHPGSHFRTVHIFIRDPHGELLLQELAAGRERNASKWGSSVAAYVRFGETYEEAARRRLAEELALAVPLSLVGTTIMPDLGGYKHVWLFSGVARRSRPTIGEPDHIAKLKWRSSREIDAWIQDQPNEFTETFRWLWKTFCDGRYGGLQSGS